MSAGEGGRTAVLEGGPERLGGHPPSLKWIAVVHIRHSTWLVDSDATLCHATPRYATLRHALPQHSTGVRRSAGVIEDVMR